jgi:hypothetical protein
VRSTACVCGRSPAEILGSNPTGSMDICLVWVSCVVRYRSLRRTDHTSRGVLSTVVRRCVWSKNLKNARWAAASGGGEDINPSHNLTTDKWPRVIKKFEKSCVEFWGFTDQFKKSRVEFWGYIDQLKKIKRWVLRIYRSIWKIMRWVLRICRSIWKIMRWVFRIYRSIWKNHALSFEDL